MQQQGQDENQYRPKMDEKLAKIVPRTSADSDDEMRDQKHVKKKESVQVQGNKSLRWTLQENKIYIKFLEEHAHLFRYKSVRRVRQVFILLSDKMNRKRTPAQCKSHHQKMRKATEKGTIKQILTYMKRKHIQKLKPMPLAKEQKKIPSPQLPFEVSETKNRNKLEIRVKLQPDFISIW